MTKTKNQAAIAQNNDEAASPGPRGKLGVLAALLQRDEGATITELVEATGWQKHSVRGAMAGSLQKKHGFTVASDKTGESRVYRASKGPAA